MTSGSAVGKSLDNGFTREEHYEAAQNILEIFKTAKFVETQPPKNGSPDILGVHKYMGEYKNANVKITIKEIKEHGNTFYSIELMELLSRDMQSGDPKTGNLDNTAIIHTDEEPPRPRTSSPYNANSKTIPNQSIKEAENLTQYRKDIEAKYNIRPIKEFGTNYAEFYHDGKGAINKLLVEKQGQVAGAFEREGLGDIDLVWGEFEVVKGDIKGYGLSKIEAKHLNDFAIFEGSTPQEKMANGIAEIIEKGEIKIDNNSRTTIVYNKNDKVYKIGLKQNWQGNPTENKWIVTAYDDIREANKIINSKGFTKGETLPLNSSGNSTTTTNKSQELNLSRAERRAMRIEEPKGKTLVIDEKKAEISEVLNGSGNSKTLSAYAEIKSSKTPELTTAENFTPKTTKSQGLNLSRAERRAMGKEESKSVSGRRTNLSATQSASEKTTSQNTHLEKDLDISAKPITKGTNSPLNSKTNSTPKEMKSQELNLSRKEAETKTINQANLAQNAIKGDGFVTYPNSARQETAINQNFNIQEWVKNMSGVISDKWRANLTKLANKHPEMFRSEADVFRVIKEIKDNPTYFFKNHDDDIALIGKKLNNNKDGNIGIVKNSGEIIHTNKNRSGDLDRLQRKQLKNYEKDGAIAGTPAPATTRPNDGVEGEIIKNRTNAETIPNQNIKQAETAKEPNLSRAERRAMGIEEPKGKTLVIDDKAM